MQLLKQFQGATLCNQPLLASAEVNYLIRGLSQHTSLSPRSHPVHAPFPDQPTVNYCLSHKTETTLETSLKDYAVFRMTTLPP